MYTTRTCLSYYEADNEPSNIGTVTCLCEALLPADSDPAQPQD